MVSHTTKCTRCGWWDMSMKYGHSSACTRCGAVLISHERDDHDVLDRVTHLPGNANDFLDHSTQG